jgi:hypothetical protein
MYNFSWSVLLITLFNSCATNPHITDVDSNKSNEIKSLIFIESASKHPSFDFYDANERILNETSFTPFVKDSSGAYQKMLKRNNRLVESKYHDNLIRMDLKRNQLDGR